MEPDDLEAVRTIIAALDPFNVGDRERILRWVREKLGVPLEVSAMGSSRTQESIALGSTAPTIGHARDIKSFIEMKRPQTDNQFAAAVAYYYTFEAPEAQRKQSITADDLQEACRQAGRQRLARPSQTLIKAHTQGYLDKSGERGGYMLNTVGENLVAMTLPEGAYAPSGGTRKRNSTQRKRQGTGRKKSR